MGHTLDKAKPRPIEAIPFESSHFVPGMRNILFRAIHGDPYIRMPEAYVSSSNTLYVKLRLLPSMVISSSCKYNAFENISLILCGSLLS